MTFIKHASRTGEDKFARSCLHSNSFWILSVKDSQTVKHIRLIINASSIPHLRSLFLCKVIRQKLVQTMVSELAAPRMSHLLISTNSLLSLLIFSYACLLTLILIFKDCYFSLSTLVTLKNLLV